MSELPRPITNDQEYLAAILDELRGISAKLDTLVAQTQPVELVEPCIVISEPAPVPPGELVQAVDVVLPAPDPALDGEIVDEAREAEAESGKIRKRPSTRKQT